MINDQLYANPYGLAKSKKKSYFAKIMKELTELHYDKCEYYANIIDTLYPRSLNDDLSVMENIPFIPVSIFKKMKMHSVNDKDIFKTLSSSGTSSSQPSKIILDRETAMTQTKVLSSIVQNYLGKIRLPMIIVDKESTIKSKAAFNARAAGIIGFSQFGRDHFYLLDENENIRINDLQDFINEIRDQKLFIFGFTFMLWKYLYQETQKLSLSLNFNNGVVLHGGGWKRLKDQAVSEEIFKKRLSSVFNLSAVHNYYGFIEQVGSIFIECEYGHLHASDFSDIIIRDQKTLAPLPFNQIGLIQGLSILSKSYPGHSILTKDLGVCLGEDDCACERKGKYFKVIGRLPAAEIRGCSDTH